MVARLFVLEGSKVSKRMNNIIFSSKKHQVVGQLVLESNISTLNIRPKVVNGVSMERRVGRSRGIIKSGIS